MNLSGIPSIIRTKLSEKGILKTLDVYIIKKFLGTFFFLIALIIGISIIFDISEKIDDFIEKKAPLVDIIFKYYFNFIPYYVNLFLFLFVFLSVIFFTSKMAARCEIVAILSSGVSFNRLLYPYFLSALVLAIFSFLLSAYIIPPANRVRLDFENTYINGVLFNEETNIHKQVEPNVYMYISSYNVLNDMGSRFSIEKFKNKKLVYKMMSDFVLWDTVKHVWIATNYYIRTIDNGIEKIEEGQRKEFDIKIAPKEFKRRSTDLQTMNIKTLNEFIKEQRLHGAENLNVYLVESYKLYAFPFATFILTMIGVSIASRKVRGGTGVFLGIGLLISFAYILFLQIASQFAISSTVSPLLAVWTPNIIFSILGIYLYRSAPK
jgi:lipopolysaccharide export system permease protein